MAIVDTRWMLLLLPASMLAGAMISEALHAPSGGSQDEVQRRQAQRIVTLESALERARVKRIAIERERPEREAGAPEGLRLRGAEDAEAPTRADVAAETSSPARGPTQARPPPLTGVPPTGILDAVRLLGAQDARQTDTALVDDAEGFARSFTPKPDGPVVRAEETTPDAEVQDGTTIVLDAGIYDFAEFSSAHRGAFPADLTFRGIGMDRTLLVLHEIGATGVTKNLGFEDLTLDTRGHYLADVRGDEPISLRFVRSRVIGFDQHPGGAVLLAARHGALFARESRFEAGFGNAPGKGSLFHVRGPFLVRFEQCVFTGAFKSLYEQSDRAAYAFVGCRFEQMAPELKRDLETPDPNLRFEDCHIEYAAVEPDRPPATRSRSELNPTWR